MESLTLTNMEIIKRKKHTESYDERKVYASVYAAALNCHYTDEKAEKLAAKVAKVATRAVKQHTKKKSSTPLTSHDIRNMVIKHCADPEVTFMYIHHLDLC